MKNFLVLFSGNTAAQLITIIASPVLTRLYKPEDFGVFSTYSSILIVLLTFSSLCLEKAIPLESSKKNRLQLIYISAMSITFVAVLNLVIYLFWSLSLFNIFGVSTNLYLQLSLSLGLIFAGFYQVLSYTNIRTKRFKQLTASKLGQSWVNVGGQIGLYQVAMLGSGLITGDILGRAAGLAILTRDFFKDNQWSKINPQKMKQLVIKYREFPLFSTLSTMFNSLSLQLVILLLMSFYGSDVAGYYSLTQKAIGIPLTLIGIAISQVFYSEVAENFKTNRAEVYQLYCNIIKKLTIVAVPAIIILIVIAPWLFSFVFGETWRISGEYAQLVAFLFLGQFIFMPISQVLYATGHQKTQLGWDFGRCVVVLIGMLTLYKLGFSVEIVLLYFGMVMGASYFVLGFLGWRVLKAD